MTIGPLNQARFTAGLELCRNGRMVGDRPNIELLDVVTCTIDAAWERLGRPDADGFAVFAERQSAGRGRLGRSWESPRGASLLCSVLLNAGVIEAPADQAVFGAQFRLFGAIAAHDAISEAVGISVEVKWPNDLVDPTASILVQLDDGWRQLFDAAAATVVDP